MRLHPYELMYFALSINNISHLHPGRSSYNNALDFCADVSLVVLVKFFVFKILCI